MRDPWESDSLERLRGWHVIMAASGMCDAGRVRKHLKRLLWRREATVLIAGYQATGTLGRILLDGARNVRIQGEDIHVRARIRNLDIYSAHADATGLTAWAKARGRSAAPSSWPMVNRRARRDWLTGSPRLASTKPRSTSRGSTSGSGCSRRGLSRWKTSSPASPRRPLQGRTGTMRAPSC